ncbi:MAG: hypothetical protein HY606_02425, partial [Planctomycetes bacterium]|nr:hypothetical protein [Planctomycetota bacterium]
LISFRTIPFDLNSLLSELKNSLVESDSKRVYSEILISEIIRFTSIYQDIEVGSFLVLCPDGEDLVGSLIEKALNLKKTELNLSNIQNKTQAPFSELISSFGLALRGLTKTQISMNFIKDQFAHKEKTLVIKNALTFTLQLLIVLVCFYSLKLYFYDYKVLSDAVENENSGIYERQKKLVRDFAKEFNIRDVKIDKISREEYQQYFDELVTQQNNKYGVGYPIEIDIFPVLTKLYTAMNEFYSVNQATSVASPMDILRIERLYLDIEGADKDKIKVVLVYYVTDESYGTRFDGLIKKHLQSEFTKSEDGNKKDGWVKLHREINVIKKKEGL